MLIFAKSFLRVMTPFGLLNVSVMPKNLISEYSEWMVARGYLAATSAETYCNDIRLFARWAKQSSRVSSWSSAATKDFEDFVSYLVANDYEFVTINRILSALTSLYSWLKHQGRLSQNPLYDVRRLRPDFKQRQPIAAEAIRKALLSPKVLPSTKAMIALLAESGLRLGEAQKLMPSDINLATKEIMVQGKGRSHRIAHFGDTAALYLNEYMSGRSFPDGLFPLSRRQYNWDVYHALAPFCGGRKCSPHILRHTFATLSLENGMPLQSLSVTLGHRNLATTMIYNHASSEAIHNDYCKYAPKF